MRRNPLGVDPAIWWECRRKIRHRRRGAEQELRRLSDRLRSLGQINRLVIYHCRYCGAWHIGKTPAATRADQP